MRSLLVTIAIYIACANFCNILINTHATQENFEFYPVTPKNLNININSLILIFNEFLPISDLLQFRNSCRYFQNLIQPKEENNIYADVVVLQDRHSQKMMTLNLNWNELKYYCDKSCDYMKKFSQVKKYMRIYNAWSSSWARITQEGTVETGGALHLGVDTTSVQDKLTNVKKLFNTSFAFTALLKNRQVITWGCLNAGKMEKEINDVQNVFSNHDAFVCLLRNGNVEAWGDVETGGRIPEKLKNKLKNVKQISSTEKAFAVVTDSGQVFSWGDKNFGGEIPNKTQIKLNNGKRKRLYSNKKAFACLLQDDGNVFFWGCPFHGGTNNLDPICQNVKTIFSNNESFTVLSKCGKVFAWEEGEISMYIHNVKNVYANGSAFAAILQNGTVRAWGSPLHGGTCPSPLEIKDVIKIVSTRHGFLALNKFGNVHAWGGELIPSHLEHEIHSIKMIFSTYRAFAVLRRDNFVFTWGMFKDDIIKNLNFRLNDVENVFSFGHEFIALFKNGNTFVWHSE